jgi:hypothetical protein
LDLGDPDEKEDKSSLAAGFISPCMKLAFESHLFRYLIPNLLFVSRLMLLLETCTPFCSRCPLVSSSFFFHSLLPCFLVYGVVWWEFTGGNTWSLEVPLLSLVRCSSWCSRLFRIGMNSHSSDFMGLPRKILSHDSMSPFSVVGTEYDSIRS